MTAKGRDLRDGSGDAVGDGDAARAAANRDRLRVKRADATHALRRMTPDSLGYQRAEERNAAAKVEYDAAPTPHHSVPAGEDAT